MKARHELWVEENLREPDWVTMEDEFTMTASLASKVKRTFGSPDVIYAVAPGGLMIAEWLSRRFLGSWRKPIPVRAINLCTAGDQPRVVQPDGLTAGGSEEERRILLVCDATNSGGTLRAAREHVQRSRPSCELRTAVLIRNVLAGKVDFWVRGPVWYVPRFEWKYETRKAP